MYGKFCFRFFVADYDRIDLKTQQIDAKSRCEHFTCWRLVLKVNIDEVIQMRESGRIVYYKATFPHFLPDLFRDELRPRSQQVK